MWHGQEVGKHVTWNNRSVLQKITTYFNKDQLLQLKKYDGLIKNQEYR